MYCVPSNLYSKLEDLPVPYGRLTSRFSSTADALLVSRKSNTNLFQFSANQTCSSYGVAESDSSTTETVNGCERDVCWIGLI